MSVCLFCLTPVLVIYHIILIIYLFTKIEIEEEQKRKHSSLCRCILPYITCSLYNFDLFGVCCALRFNLIFYRERVWCVAPGCIAYPTFRVYNRFVISILFSTHEIYQIQPGFVLCESHTHTHTHTHCTYAVSGQRVWNTSSPLHDYTSKITLHIKTPLSKWFSMCFASGRSHLDIGMVGLVSQSVQCQQKKVRFPSAFLWISDYYIDSVVGGIWGSTLSLTLNMFWLCVALTGKVCVLWRGNTRDIQLDCIYMYVSDDISTRNKSN